MPVLVMLLYGMPQLAVSIATSWSAKFAPHATGWGLQEEMFCS